MTPERVGERRTTTAYESVQKASVVAVVVAVVATALWFIAVPVAQGWLKDWAVHPPGVVIPLWKRLLIYYAEGWRIVWPAFVLFAWVVSIVPIELVRRIKARRSQAITPR